MPDGRILSGFARYFSWPAPVKMKELPPKKLVSNRTKKRSNIRLYHNLDIKYEFASPSFAVVVVKRKLDIYRYIHFSIWQSFTDYTQKILLTIVKVKTSPSLKWLIKLGYILRQFICQRQSDFYLSYKHWNHFPIKPTQS